jgi:hypothetical protein
MKKIVAAEAAELQLSKSLGSDKEPVAADVNTRVAEREGAPSLETFVYVEEDSDGDVDEPPSRSSQKRAHKKKSKVGPVDKNSDMFVVDHGGEWLKAQGGGQVKINLAKFVLVKVSEDTIRDCEVGL